MMVELFLKYLTADACRWLDGLGLRRWIGLRRQLKRDEMSKWAVSSRVLEGDENKTACQGENEFENLGKSSS